MAESIPKEILSERNLLLAKLMSLFGDSVDFDVINIVAQENDWSEVACVESLKVLGEYKNPQPKAPSANAEDFVWVDVETAGRAADNMSGNTSKKVTVTSRAPVQNRPGPIAGNEHLRNAAGGHNSPFQTIFPKPTERSSESEQHHEQVKNLIRSGTPVIILLRGLPGSGKSTLANQLLSLPGANAGCKCSADNYFVRSKGGKGPPVYEFDPLKLSDAHEHCRIQVLRALAHGVSPIIIDNTNTQAWEMMPYVEMAIEPWRAEEKLRNIIADRKAPKKTLCGNLGPSRNSFKGQRCPCGFTVMEKPLVPYQVELLEPLTWWYQNTPRLAKMNQHGVSQKKISQMLSHFEFGLTGKGLVKQMIKKRSVQHPVCNEKVPPANKAGRPLINMNPKKNSAGETGPIQKNKSQPKAPGRNMFQHNSVNQFQNIGFSPGPLPSPLFGTGFNPIPLSSNASHPVLPFPPPQLNVVRNAKPEIKNPRMPFHGITPSEIFPTTKSASNSSLFSDRSFSIVSQSGSSSLVDNRRSSESGSGSNGASGQAYSSKIGHIEPNPFMLSSHSLDSYTGTSDTSEIDCVELTEEEQREWQEANASKWADWNSSDEESDDDCGVGVDEPKPARLHPPHRFYNKSPNDGSSPMNLDVEVQQEDETVNEWETEGVDPLASWNSSKNSCDNPVEPKIQGPLPPRSPKKRRDVEETPAKSAESVEVPEEASTNPINLEYDLIKEIRRFLEVLGKNNEGMDAIKRAVESSQNSSEFSGNLRATDPNGPEADTIASAGGNCTTSGEKVDSDLQRESPDSPMSVLNVHLENMSSEGSNVSGEVGGVEIECASNLSGSSGELDNSATLGSEMNMVNNHECTDMNGISKHTPVSMNADIIQAGPINELKMTGEDSMNEIDTSLESRDNASEGNDLEVDELPANYDKDVPTKTSDNLENPRENENSSVVFDRIDSRKNALLQSLLLGKEKMNCKSGEEFEKSSVLPEIGNVDEPLASEFNAFELTKEKYSNPQGLTVEFPEDIVKNSLKDPPKASETEEDSQHFSSSTSPTGDDVRLANDMECKIPYVLEDESISSHTVSSMLGKPGLVDSSKNEVKVVESSSASGDQQSTTLTSSPNEPPIPIISLPSRNTNEELSGSTELNGPPTSCELKDDKDNGVNSVTDSEGSHDLENASQPFSSTADKRALVPEIPSESEWESAEDNLLDDSSETIGSHPERTMTLAELWELRRKRIDFGLADADASTSNHFYFEQDSEIAVKSSSEQSTVGDCGESVNPPAEQNLVSPQGERVIDLDENGEMLPLVLNSSFVELICQKFGNPYEESLYEPGKLPGQAREAMVNIPTSLARKLHEYWLKSQWDAILIEEEVSHSMILEDELLARQLQELEKEESKDDCPESNSSSNTPNLREIMDMEMAMAMYKADQNKKVQSNQRNDMSTRLSWDLLTKEFPQIPQDIVTEVFSAYNFSYASAREALLSSLPDYEVGVHDVVKEVVSPEAIAAQEKALIEKAKMESLKYQRHGLTDKEEEEEEEGEDAEDSWEVLVDEARKSAALNRKLQKERHAQAQAANRSGMSSAATYYCQMATLHKQKAEEANRRAASILSKVFTGDHGNLKGVNAGKGPITPPPATLDMHSMSVLEAVRVMNAFLDAHAEWLRRERNRQYPDVRKGCPLKMATLFLVTGRGMNSQGGIPRIKPAVERQLEKRGVWYEEMNPGLLRVMVSSNLPVTKKV